MKISLKILIGIVLGFTITSSGILPSIIYSINPPGWTSFTEPDMFEALEELENNGTSNQFTTEIYQIVPPWGDAMLLLTVYINKPLWVQRVWIIDEDLIISSPASNDISYSHTGIMRWSDIPSILSVTSVDVVLKLKCRINGQKIIYYLIAKDQNVQVIS